MRLEIHSKGVQLTDALREHIDRHVKYALSTFGERIRYVRVRLSDLNGPRGGEDIRCQIRAHVAPSGDVFINETRSDSFGAVARACDRIQHTVSRHLGRLRSRRRRG